MRLRALLSQIDPQLANSLDDVDLTGVTEDSRCVQPGNLFIARSGTKMDGAQFLADAKARGAAAAVVTQAVKHIGLPQIVVPDSSRAASIFAHLFYHKPCAKVRTLGITGTNGKTTTTYLVRHLLKNVGVRCGLIGTVEIDDGKSIKQADMTTPPAAEIARLLATMRDRGCRAAAMEVSSHALDQGRVAGVTFCGAAFTNLTGDHLDYHKTMDNYGAAKAKLFEMLPDAAVAVINGESKYSERMIRDCSARIMRYGFGAKADYRAKDVAITSMGTQFMLITPDGKAEVDMPMVGKHNIENVLAAAALVGEVFALTVNQIASGLKDCHGAPGRLQPVRCGQPFGVFVDYAHTDDALENVLCALKPLAKGKLRVLFGAGGDRDRTKRPRMAKVAEKHADAIYITSDNPRTENPRAIIDEILAGIPGKSGKPVYVNPDRRAAIEKILGDSQEADVVLIAGKGHENYQIIGAEKHHFDDIEEAERYLRAHVAA